MWRGTALFQKKRPSGGQKSGRKAIVSFGKKRFVFKAKPGGKKNADTGNFPRALLVRGLKKEGGKAVFCRGQEEGNSVRKEAKYAQKAGNPPKTRGFQSLIFYFVLTTFFRCVKLEANIDKSR